jgi:divinyl chlorophyllide a 8-vinyl-reductase
LVPFTPEIKAHCHTQNDEKQLDHDNTSVITLRQNSCQPQVRLKTGDSRAFMHYNPGVSSQDPKNHSSGMKVLLLGATGTIGQATLQSLIRQGHHVVCLRRPVTRPCAEATSSLAAEWRFVDMADPKAVLSQGFQHQRFDAVVSCMASRSGTPDEAWAIDHQAHLHVLDAAITTGTRQFILLSAICVQKPRLAFQHAKLAFEQALISSGLTYSIVRPTAYFKSLSGQIERLRQGKPFWVFGDGQLTSCKPISDEDLGHFLTNCLNDPQRHNRILPIGGPGPAITPLEQARELFRLLNQPIRVKHMPVWVLTVIVRTLGAIGLVWPSVRKKAELARIGHYYATESMLILNPQTGLYDEANTPSCGHQTLFEYYARVIAKQSKVELGEHAIF